MKTQEVKVDGKDGRNRRESGREGNRKRDRTVVADEANIAREQVSPAL